MSHPKTPTSDFEEGTNFPSVIRYTAAAFANPRQQLVYLYFVYYPRWLYSCGFLRTARGCCELIIPDNRRLSFPPEVWLFVYRKEGWITEWKTVTHSPSPAERENKSMAVPCFTLSQHCLKGRLWSQTWVLFHCHANSKDRISRSLWVISLSLLERKQVTAIWFLCNLGRARDRFPACTKAR